MLGLTANREKLPGYLSLSLLATMWLLPFLYFRHLWPIDAYHSEWSAMLLGLLAVLAYCPALLRNTPSLPRIALLPLALAAILGLQTLLLPQLVKESVQLGMAALFWAALVMTLAHNLPRAIDLKTVVNALALVLVLGALCQSGLEFWFRFRLGLYGNWGGLGQANHYGDYLSLGLASALYLMAKSRPGGGWMLILLATATALIVLALSLSTSRSIWLYLLALAVLAGIYPCRERRRLLTGVALASALFVLLQAAWSLGWLPSSVQIPTSGERFFQEVNGAPIRLHIWRVAWQLFLQAPWLGQGFGEFDWAYFASGDTLPGITSRLENAHNIILQLLVETGVLSVLLLLGGLGFWLRNSLKANLALEGWWLLALLAVLGLHSLVEYPLWYCHFLGLAAVLLGLGEQKGYQLRLGNAGTWTMGLALSVLVLVCISHRNSYMRLESTMNSLLFDKNKPSLPAVIETMKSVSADAPSLAPYVTMAFTTIGEDDEGASETLLALGDASVHFLPSPHLAYRQVLQLALGGKQDESAALMKQCLKMYPAHAERFIVKALQGYTLASQQKTAFLLEMVKGQAGGNL